MKNLLYGLAAIIALVQVTACTTTREDSGAMMGAVLGGVVGSQIGGGSGKDLATAVGLIAGAFAGANIGKSLDQQDAANTQHAFENNKTNQTSQWVNPDSGNEYSVTPTKTYQSTAGRYCREYQTTVTVGGNAEEAYGTACRQPDGDWEIIK